MTIQEKKFLADIVEAILSIDEHLEGKRIFTEYKASKTKRRAVERELEIIGEAVNKLLKINPTAKISYARMIVDLRNKVIHAYDNVNDIVIWNVVVNHLPGIASGS
ncbi:HepT-like ribonuclease domain-containing protein [uncultured Mucilaginibacter sp.]|uniref:HepT-like ribonuclease domain-containing protein n=1 Tax=uncultured Mucilaginibacter sp. TaxID=797541 RepID=UPI002617601E|nr:HepT-like ribonuclease domain-containing protein [uncultured Mucilaginibacter sp.]